ncbi:MAG: secondary thiamine-phosphate synthase enzyme YjbQ [Gammaproteobacteria bacterium]|nr:secondary thiamine-phosphate synthase enzyme YjbQ [Gammaproteobacteria bacterium]
MPTYQQTITINTLGRDTYNITRNVEKIIKTSGIKTGLCNIFIKHTSASLIISENADPDVRHDLENFMEKIAPDGDRTYAHQDEGPDDMPAHIRTVLTQTAISIPVVNSQAGLGTWQGIYCWEHRTHPHQRSLIITVTGD